MRPTIAMALVMLAATAAPSAPSPEQSSVTHFIKGYLSAPVPSDSILLSPAPPEPGSPAEARDVDAANSAVRLRGTARWALAARDADLSTPTMAEAFSCAAGRDIGPQSTPAVNKLLRNTLTDLGLSTSVIKRRYQRPRPFMINHQPTCTPSMESVLRRDGSYPSGHSAIGYGWGLILAELFPGRANALVARGRAFGDSRRVCNVHWLSDVEEGRIAASTVVARLHADAEFRTDMDSARTELARSRAAPPKHDCVTETAMLAQ
ncbi:MAG: phosphatase PAP2 family protein [Sphingomicrobium sp.]